MALAQHINKCTRFQIKMTAFGLRSYIFILLHAVIAIPLRAFGVEAVWGKVGVYYGVRVVLALLSAACQVRFDVVPP